MQTAGLWLCCTCPSGEPTFSTWSWLRIQNFPAFAECITCSALSKHCHSYGCVWIVLCILVRKSTFKRVSLYSSCSVMLKGWDWKTQVSSEESLLRCNCFRLCLWKSYGTDASLIVKHFYLKLTPCKTTHICVIIKSILNSAVPAFIHLESRL